MKLLIPQNSHVALVGGGNPKNTDRLLWKIHIESSHLTVTGLLVWLTPKPCFSTPLTRLTTLTVPLLYQATLQVHGHEHVAEVIGECTSKHHLDRTMTKMLWPFSQSFTSTTNIPTFGRWILMQLHAKRPGNNTRIALLISHIGQVQEASARLWSNRPPSKSKRNAALFFVKSIKCLSKNISSTPHPFEMWKV